MPRVLNRNKDAIPTDAVYIGRPTPWGNPFKVYEANGRQVAVNRYRDYAEFMVSNNPNWLDPLRGKDLVCSCSPLACHGDVLMELMGKGIDTQ